MKYRVILLFFVIFILILFYTPVYAIEEATFLWAVDGDTLKVAINGQKESVRLIGIDTPETRLNKKTRRDSIRSGQDIEVIMAMGREALAFTKSLIKKGDTVQLEFDVQKRDKYRRLLAYAYKDGKMLNDEIVKAGYASLMTIPPNIKYQDKFRQSYREAREARRGLWR